jgi:poly(3-hydroxyalkanoate) synthetase
MDSGDEADGGGWEQVKGGTAIVQVSYITIKVLLCLSHNDDIQRWSRAYLGRLSLDDSSISTDLHLENGPYYL